MAISNRDYRKILEIIDIIYSVPDNGAMFAVMSHKLQRHIGISSSVFIFYSKTGQFIPDEYHLFGQSETQMVSYLSHYVSLDPLIQQEWPKKSYNRVAAYTDYVPKNRLLKSEFGNDFLLHKAGIFFNISASLVAQGDMIGGIAFHRKLQQEDFSDRDKKIVNYIIPHMACAIRNHQLMNGLDFTKESCGVIAVGENGKPFYMNEPAKLAIKNKPITAIPEPGMGSHPAFFKGGSGTYRVRTVPLGKKNIGKVILLERHPPEHKISPKLMEFHLSRREEEVVMLVIQGLANLEIAQKLFIAEQTVKDHLHHVFGKMNIRRRSEIAAKVMGLAPQAASPV